MTGVVQTEVVDNAMEPILSETAQIILAKRYLKKDLKGNVIESPQDLFMRVARSIAAADAFLDPGADVEATCRKFLALMTSLRFLPNSPTLMNAGRRLGQLAACFVLPVEDSIESIFNTLKYTAIIHKSGGGTGFSFSRIRPANDTVLSTAGISSGPVSFMNIFDVATETVKQGGTRRGANMGVLRVDHPDVETFIQAKRDQNILHNFNISVAVTDRFMEALKQGTEYELINPRTQEPVRQVSARRIFDLIVGSAWENGEPGVIFLDRINSANPTPHLGPIEATNPCGEQPLLPYESCTLGSINLAAMVSRSAVDFALLKETIHNAVHFLDNVVEVNQYPLPQIAEKSRLTRKIGLGVMGFADMLIRLGIPYDCDEAVQTAETVMAFVTEESRQASAALGKARGNFPAYPGSAWDRSDTPYMRNATTTTIAPTGTISILAGTSSGIEPIFAVAHVRTILDDRSFPEIHPLFSEAAKSEGFYSPELMEIIAGTGSIQDVEAVPDHLKPLFKTSHEISPAWHVKMQAAFQKHTDNAVSKTVNFPRDTTREQVEAVYLQAFESGLKGITIYRYGSRGRQVLNIGPGKGVKIAPRPRPVRTRGVTERISTGCGKLYVTINEDDEGMCEVFAQMGKTGGCASSQIEAAGRLISLALRSGVSVEAVIKQLIGIRCPSPAWQNGRMILSCPDAIAQILQNCGLNGAPAASRPTNGEAGVCPDCGAPLAYLEGCQVCPACAFSKCG